MSKIALVTDSTCDLPQEIIKRYDIKILPLKVIYSNAEYKDRVDITPEEIYSRFDEEIPKTSLPSLGECIDLFNKLESEGYTHLIVTTISSGLSGTINMIRNAKSAIENLVIEIIDSKSLSMGLGYPVLEGAKELEKTKDYHKTIKKIKEVISRTDTYYVVKTLEYLKKGGRIGRVEGTIGDLLRIKPIISINEEGVYYTYKKIRGRKRSLKALYNLVKERAEKCMINVAVAHGDAYDEGIDLLDKIKKIKNVKEVTLTQISPVLVVHTGPGLVGVIVSDRI
ncbi:DegV family protein [Clostridium sp. D2Q-11]|uniref:DegV family protein n=1 Tax=Anaeromonas frigoriresistens TaxID=2683708 RepID=A0A942Z9U0_9FIRM|nr:DegV family protein [Anaeromonas frigoriresistens]MBS4539514.1 DegV family protein [Anaeromonas frigoriresistens]